MKNDLFSGFDEIKSTDTLKQKIMCRVKSDSSTSVPAHGLRKKWILVAVCIVFASFIAVPVASVIKTTSVFPTERQIAAQPSGKQNNVSRANSTLQNKKFVILKTPPAKLNGAVTAKDYMRATEEKLYESSAIIAYGEVTGFKWVQLNKDSACDSSMNYRTIVTIQIIKSYKGSFKPGGNVDILLPVAVTGDGSGWAEDNENAAKLQKGSRAVFFAYKFSDDDLIGDETWNIHGKDICQYGTGWGEESILVEDYGSFYYDYPQTHKLTFQEMESVINSKLHP